jgi:plastocyanin
MEADPICLASHKEPQLTQAIVLGGNNTLANVFVYVKSGLTQTTYPAPSQPIIIDQKDCNYSPRVLGVMVGQTVKVLNPDGTLHNVHGKSKINREFNIAMPNFRKEMEKTFDQAEFMFPLRCDVHPWMIAWISVMQHPFFSVSDTEGRFEIKNLSPGTYEIEAWHEKLGTQKATVTITDQQAQTINFKFSPPKG